MGAPKLMPLAQATEDSRTLVLVKGFLSRNETAEEHHEEWVAGLREASWKGEIYLFSWDASTEAELRGDMVFNGIVGGLAGFGIATAARTGLKYVLPRVIPGPWTLSSWAMTGAQLVSAAVALRMGTSHGARQRWNAVRDRSEKIGREELFPAIRQAGIDTVTLVGHSLGARLIDSALRSGDQSGVTVEDTLYFGGALARDDEEAWRQAAVAITGTLLNVYYSNDDVLRRWYEAVEDHVPCGRGAVEAEIPNLLNVSADSHFAPTDHGHYHYRKHIRSLLADFDWMDENSPSLRDSG